MLFLRIRRASSDTKGWFDAVLGTPPVTEDGAKSPDGD